MNSWLLDTTYILPFFGINVEIKNIKNDLKKIITKLPDSLVVTSCSLIEGKWKTLQAYKKTRKNEYLTRGNLALEGFKTNRYFKILNPWIVPNATKFADELFQLGHVDYMDCWIAGTAKAENANLVTEDKQLKQLIKKIPNWKKMNILSWDTFLKKI
ncbi:MAG: PIN domain-containing protein [Candidatus Ranarchaeia archaeon]